MNKRLLLEISTLITDRDVEVLHYEVGGPAWRFSGELVKRRTDEPYRQVIGEIPDSWGVSLLTPDPRLALIVEPAKDST